MYFTKCMNRTILAVRWRKKGLCLALLVSVVRDNAETAGSHAASCIFPTIENVRIE